MILPPVNFLLIHPSPRAPRIMPMPEAESSKPMRAGWVRVRCSYYAFLLEGLALQLAYIRGQRVCIVSVYSQRILAGNPHGQRIFVSLCI